MYMLEHKHKLKDTKITEIQFTGHNECRVGDILYFKQILRLTDLKFHPNRVCIVNSCYFFQIHPTFQDFLHFLQAVFGKHLFLQMDLQDLWHPFSASLPPARNLQVSNGSGRDALVELHKLERSFQDDLTEWREKLQECRVFSAFSYLITVM